jgi:hypothetical protein
MAKSATSPAALARDASMAELEPESRTYLLERSPNFRRVLQRARCIGLLPDSSDAPFGGRSRAFDGGGAHRGAGVHD